MVGPSVLFVIVNFSSYSPLCRVCNKNAKKREKRVGGKDCNDFRVCYIIRTRRGRINIYIGWYENVFLMRRTAATKPIYNNIARARCSILYIGYVADAHVYCYNTAHTYIRI